MPRLLLAARPDDDASTAAAVLASPGPDCGSDCEPAATTTPQSSRPSRNSLSDDPNSNTTTTATATASMGANPAATSSMHVPPPPRITHGAPYYATAVQNPISAAADLGASAAAHPAPAKHNIPAAPPWPTTPAAPPSYAMYSNHNMNPTPLPSFRIPLNDSSDDYYDYEYDYDDSQSDIVDMSATLAASSSSTTLNKNSRSKSRRYKRSSRRREDHEIDDDEDEDYDDQSRMPHAAAAFLNPAAATADDDFYDDDRINADATPLLPLPRAQSQMHLKALSSATGPSSSSSSSSSSASVLFLRPTAASAAAATTAPHSRARSRSRPISAVLADPRIARVRRNWMHHVWSNMDSISRGSRLLLVATCVVMTVEIFAGTFSLLIAHATGEVCDSRLDIYLVVFVLREVLCLPLVIYQFMNPETAPSTRTATTAQATALSPANVPTAPVVSAASAPVRSANSNIMSVGAAEQPNTPLDQTSSDHSAVDGNQLSTAASALPSSLSSHPHLFSSATSAGHPKLLAAAVSAASSNSSAAIQSQISTEQHHGQLHHQPQQQQELQQQQQLRPKQINGSNNSSSSSPTRSSRYRRRTPKAKNARLAGHINRLKSVLDMFGILWFIVGNWLVFTSSSKCIAVPRDGGGGGGGAALLYRCSVAFLGIGYVLVCVPIVLFLGIVFCLPVVLVWSKVMRGLASPGGWSRVPASSHAGGYGYGYAGGASGGAGGGNAGGGYGYGGGYYNGGSNGGSNSNNTSSFGSTGGGAAWQRDDDDDDLGAPDAVIRTFPVLVYRGGGGGGSGSNSADAPIDKKRSSGFADPLLNAWAVPMGAAAHHSGVESRRSKSVAANSNSTSSSGSAGGFVATLYERVLSDVRRSIDSGSAAGQWSVSADRRSRGAPDGGRQGRYSYAEVDGGADEYDNSGFGSNSRKSSLLSFASLFAPSRNTSATAAGADPGNNDGDAIPMTLPPRPRTQGASGFSFSSAAGADIAAATAASFINEAKPLPQLPPPTSAPLSTGGQDPEGLPRRPKVMPPRPAPRPILKQDHRPGPITFGNGQGSSGSVGGAPPTITFTPASPHSQVLLQPPPPPPLEASRHHYDHNSSGAAATTTTTEQMLIPPRPKAKAAGTNSGTRSEGTGSGAAWPSGDGKNSNSGGASSWGAAGSEGVAAFGGDVSQTYARTLAARSLSPAAPRSATPGLSAVAAGAASSAPPAPLRRRVTAAAVQQQQRPPQLLDGATGAVVAELGGAEDAVCVICLYCYEDGERVRKLGCGHHFHVQCVDEWLRLNKTCPLCVRDVTIGVGVGAGAGGSATA